MYRQEQQHTHARQEFGGPGERWRGGGPGYDEYIHLVTAYNSHVIDVDKAKDANDTELLVYPRHTPATPNQQWRFEHVDGNRFYIVSALNQTKVIQIKDNKAKSGTKCVLFYKGDPTNPNPAQLWQKQGEEIHSCVGQNLVLAQHGGDHGTLIVETRTGKDNQRWREER